MDTNMARAINMAKAIRDQESGGKYDLPGKSGEYGAYQFTEPTWNAYAKEAGIDTSLKDATREQQNEVAVKKINDWITTGKAKNVGEVASMWNAGEGKPQAYMENNVGTNKFGVHYDTPAYAKAVAENYQKYKSTDQNNPNQFNPTPYSNPTDRTGINPGEFDLTGNNTTQPIDQPDTLKNELINRGKDISSAVTDTIAGKQNVISGLLQTVGGVAGGIGDVVNKGIELIPGVKQVENLVGQGIGSLAQTQTGQVVAKSIGDFTKEHPELSKDIGSGFNIVTAIPIIKGLGTVAKLGMEAGSQVLKSVGEKSFIEGAPEVIGNTQKATKLLSKNPDVFKDMVDRRLVGDIKNGVYTTSEDVSKSWDTIKSSNKSIGDILNQTAKNKYTFGTEDTDTILKNTLDKFPNSKFTSEDIMKNGRALTEKNGKLWDKFEAGDASLGDINKLRSDLDTAVKSVYTSVNEPPIKKEIGQTLADSMRGFVKDQAPETKPLFDEMSKQFDIQKALSLMEGKSIKPGSVAKLAGHAVGIGAGGTIGGMIGGPTGALVGGMIGEKAAGNVATKLAGQNITQGILKRTGVNAVRLSKEELAKKLSGLFGGAASEKINKR